MAEQKRPEKTEEASAQKLKKSREEGQVARSRDLATMVSLVTKLLLLRYSWSSFAACGLVFGRS